MRLTYFAAAAALCMAAPAAAQQPNADSIAIGAIQQMLANQGNVRDYTLVLAHGPVRAPAYVRRSGDQWEVLTPPDPPLAEIIATAVIWPVMISEMSAKGEGESGALAAGSSGYLGMETVDGRQAHVLFANFGEGGGGALPDSVRMYVDAGTRQLLRVDVSGVVPEDGIPGSGDMRVSLELADYREHDGLTVPMRMRVRMQGDLGVPSKERQSMREDIASARAALEALEGEEREVGRVTLDMFEGLLLRGELDMLVTVEEVRINTGAPEWSKDAGEP